MLVFTQVIGHKFIANVRHILRIVDKAVVLIIAFLGKLLRKFLDFVGGLSDDFLLGNGGLLKVDA